MRNRKKRFRRKANLNRWTHFITIAYADSKELEFRAKMRRCLSNLHTRRGWRYMGVFERVSETGRLHFHALLYVPENEMIGTITEKQDYCTKAHRMQTTYSNSFFEKRFGRNDFKELNLNEIKHGNAIGYLLKYIEKTSGRITYSRGISAELYTWIDENDVCAKKRNFGWKYVLFDDGIDWESDIQNCIAPPPKGYEFSAIYAKVAQLIPRHTPITARIGTGFSQGVYREPPSRAVVCMGCATPCMGARGARHGCIKTSGL